MEVTIYLFHIRHREMQELLLNGSGMKQKRQGLRTVVQQIDRLENIVMPDRG